tara:strand:+ start:807 stop:1040 length:234 start_codon:yes stop_codon:yes gene_type:complete
MDFLNLTTVLIIFLLIAIGYFYFQIERSIEVKKIKSEWMRRGNPKYYIYSYDDMMKFNKNTYYGFRYPKDIHYKNNL